MPRPSEYNEDRALMVCERHARGESLKDICTSDGMPGRATLYRWLHEQPVFAGLLQCARDELAEKLGDEIVAIADAVAEAAEVPVAKLRIDARKVKAQLLLLKSYTAGAQQGRAPAETPFAVTINTAVRAPSP